MDKLDNEVDYTLRKKKREYTHRIISKYSLGGKEIRLIKSKYTSLKIAEEALSRFNKRKSEHSTYRIEEI